jgi:protein tyrosine phosphatase (PTP) superfamily phosphohydrolase (DUF442 family)
MDALNTYQVFDWLWTSGQLSEKDIAELPGLGIQTVINLATPDSPNALAGEADRVARLRINYFQVPVEWPLPEVEQFNQFANLLEVCHGQKIWLHCIKNMRVSVFIYLYRSLILRESETDSAWLLHKIWTPDPTWQEFIEDVKASRLK